jgi:hypothetical protein
LRVPALGVPRGRATVAARDVVGRSVRGARRSRGLRRSTIASRLAHEHRRRVVIAGVASLAPQLVEPGARRWHGAGAAQLEVSRYYLLALLCGALADLLHCGEDARECGVSCRAGTFYGTKVCRGWQSTHAAVEKRKQHLITICHVIHICFCGKSV